MIGHDLNRRKIEREVFFAASRALGAYRRASTINRKLWQPVDNCIINTLHINRAITSRHKLTAITF